MKKRIILAVIFVQIVIISVIFLRIYVKKQVLGVKVSENPIDMYYVVAHSSNGLKYFYEPKAGAKVPDNYLGQGKGNKINADYLNERFDYSVNKPDGVFRIVTLGDSITFGQHVETRDNWTEVLEDKLHALDCSRVKKFEVINLGVWGYDNQYAVERYRLRGQKYNPDLVLWYQFDLMRYDDKIQELQKLELSVATQSAYFKNKDMPDILSATWLTAAKKVYTQFGEQNLLSIQEKAIKSLDQYYSGKLALIVFPEMKDSYKNFLKQLVETDKNYYLIDNTRDYLKENGAVDEVHPNPKGHEMIAEDILIYLKDNNLISCN